MLAILAGPFVGWGLADFVIFVIIVAAVVAILFIALRGFGVQVPPWAIQIFWVLALAFVAIIAIRLIMTF